jgi:exopolysaccharide biosynthesis polyprenyl glycosylphosphotransferase
VALVVGAFVASKIPGSLGLHWMVALGMAAGAMFVWMLGGRALRHYDMWNGRGIAGDVMLTGTLLAGLLACLGLLRYLVPHYAASTDLLRFCAVVVPAVLWLRLMTSWMVRREVPLAHVLVVGIGPLGRHTGLGIREAASVSGANRMVFGYLRFADEPPHGRLPGPLMGEAVELHEFLKKHVVDEVYIAGQDGSQHVEMQACIKTCELLGIPFALPACGFRFGRAQPVHTDAISDGYIHFLSVRHKPVQLAVKRLFDLIASALALVILMPLMVAVALAIRLTSRGPILYRQQRIGLYGRPFNMLKFRSMMTNAEDLKAKLLALNEQSGPVFKLQRDPRVTPIGRFIRKYSIDELPQLINVLRGEMTIVGPRPPILSEVERYEAWQRRRLSVRPGLTCLWQVSGRHQISFQDWMYLDMQYIDHWSLGQDFRLILKTVPVVITGRGAS